MTHFRLDARLKMYSPIMDNHGHNVTYMYDGAPDLMQWLISNPNRVNLGRVGLFFLSTSGEVLNVSESGLENKTQKLDLWTGEITSSFSLSGIDVTVKTVCAQDVDVVGIQINSSLVSQGRLGLFLDFPWNDGSTIFSAPFVGRFDATSNHTTNLIQESRPPKGSQAQIVHTFVNNSFITTIGGSKFNISRDSPDAHRYSAIPSRNSSVFSISLSYALQSLGYLPGFKSVQQSSVKAWKSFWMDAGFVDVYTGSTDPRADELQRRIILSSYLERVNEAGDYPPQESGLVNDGWYGKFHLEMVYWHSVHWALWGVLKPNRVGPKVLAGARCQTHLGVVPQEKSIRRDVQTKWRTIIKETADWVSVFAYYNESTGKYDIGPPIFLVNENTDPLTTRNPAFELSYWKYGLQLAEAWFKRLDEEVPEDWMTVQENLADLPIDNGTYSLYEGIESDFWTDPAYVNDHPSLVGLYGWLPETRGLNLTIAKATMEKTWTFWNISIWDFGMLAMSAARNNEPEQAVSWLLHDQFSFDDVGMPSAGFGGLVPPPYFPSSGSLLLAIAMMAEGWDGSSGAAPGFPQSEWNVRTEGMAKAL